MYNIITVVRKEKSENLIPYFVFLDVLNGHNRVGYVVMMCHYILCTGPFMHVLGEKHEPKPTRVSHLYSGCHHTRSSVWRLRGFQSSRSPAVFTSLLLETNHLYLYSRCIFQPQNPELPLLHLALRLSHNMSKMP